MRKLIAAMKTSLDGKIEGAEGYADWVDAWSEDYGLTSQIDACLLGGQMYLGYELYWTAIQQSKPGEPLPMTGSPPSAAEVAWARFAAETPHYVLSNTQTSSAWPNTTFIRGPEDIAALKQQPGKDIYLMGGAQITGSLIDAGLVDELRLIVYPLIAGRGKELFAATEGRHALRLRNVEQRPDGLLSLTYGIGGSPVES
jgi:dihydrofolate reductase